jgi:PadR family transcriptional regulator AphA
MLKYVLLGALSYHPLTGYQIKQFIDRSAKHFWYAQTSQIYRTLDQLQAEGLIRHERPETGDVADRRLFHLTESGRADLLEWLAQPMTELQPTKDSLLVRLFFSAQIDKETVLTQLRLQRALHQQQYKLLRDDIHAIIRTSAEQYPERQRDALMWDIARRQGELAEEMVIRWLGETIQRIENEF